MRHTKRQWEREISQVVALMANGNPLRTNVTGSTNASNNGSKKEKERKTEN